MMKSVLKTLALSFGGGLAIGAGIRLTQGGSARTRKEPGVDLDPLLRRLKSVENRIVEIESTAHAEAPERAAASTPPEMAAAFETLGAFEARLAAQFADIEQTRGAIRQLDRRLADMDSRIPATVQSLDRRLSELDAQIPVVIQSTVDLRFREVEQKLQQEFEEAQTRSMEAFVATLQNKVVDRISTLETNLADQSEAIGKLRDTSLKTDENLQKMLAGIERLVDQTRGFPSPAGTAASAPPPSAPSEPKREAISEPAFTAREQKASVLVSDVERDVESLVAEVAPDVPVLARIPELPHEEAPSKAAAHANGVIQDSTAPEHAASEAAVATLEPPVKEEMPGAEAGSAAATDHEEKAEESYEWVNRIGLELLAPRPKPRSPWKIPVVVGLIGGLVIIAALFYTGFLKGYLDPVSHAPAALASTAPTAEPPAPATTPGDLQTLEQRAAAKPGDPVSLVDLAREYARQKNWSKAEATYRSALEASPGNRDAALGLSDVLYQEQKYEESAAVLNKLSSQSKAQ